MIEVVIDCSVIELVEWYYKMCCFDCGIEYNADMSWIEVMRENQYNPFRGNCYTVCCAIKDLSNDGRQYHFCRTKDVEDIYHWWLENDMNKIDPTYLQYELRDMPIPSNKSDDEYEIMKKLSFSSYQKKADKFAKTLQKFILNDRTRTKIDKQEPPITLDRFFE